MRNVYLSIAAFLLSAAVVSSFTEPEEVDKLVRFRDAMFARPEPSPWMNALQSWTCPTEPDGSCDPCGAEAWGNWEHIACRGERITFTMDQVPGDGIVTNMHITDYNITGTVPGELCRFDRLAELDLDGGQLTGGVPTFFSECFPRLRELDLSNNKLTGTVPPEIADVKTLEQFKVEKNMLTGTLPNALGTMGNIHWFRFSANMFEGRIPDSFRSTSPLLAVLEIGDNDFDGNLYMLSDHRLINFDVAQNPRLCGMVPVGIRFAHGFNPYQTGLGLPCPNEIESGWPDL